MRNFQILIVSAVKICKQRPQLLQLLGDGHPDPVVYSPPKWKFLALSLTLHCSIAVHSIALWLYCIVLLCFSLTRSAAFWFIAFWPRLTQNLNPVREVYIAIFIGSSVLVASSNSVWHIFSATLVVKIPSGCLFREVVLCVAVFIDAVCVSAPYCLFYRRPECCAATF